jgi:hypothetical protein
MRHLLEVKETAGTFNALFGGEMKDCVWAWKCLDLTLSCVSYCLTYNQMTVETAIP